MVGFVCSGFGLCFVTTEGGREGSHGFLLFEFFFGLSGGFFFCFSFFFQALEFLSFTFTLGSKSKLFFSHLFAFVNTVLEFLKFTFILFSLFEVKCDHSLEIFKILLQSLLCSK